ncbi:hypothetical protein [Fulvivirga sediminis]|uniref:Uncharacterized protein n=1 Tax=Fulvivirga sediminis TaxID=2803949 RepID=A0A937F1F6_9BACT|nr:hypothetical protein [Fulvivirga sediminis]MBL3654516.1 hypothetical protein [Fulvivirga sediminis]
MKPAYSEEELENQFDIARKYILLTIVTTIVIVCLIGNWFFNSKKYKHSRYQQARKLSYSGIIVEKRTNSENGYRVPKYIRLNTAFETHVNQEIYHKLNLGDSVIKTENSDSVKYFLQSGDVIFEDVNKELRNRYHQSQ